jgi:DNA-3-methyladenine glycosylase
MILHQSFYARDTLTVAEQLLGQQLVHRDAGNTTAGRIVETEAYLQQDPAAHSFHGKTGSNSVLFGPPGHAHIFFIYGKHWCLNVVTGQGDRRGAVLLRALEPVDGIPVMQERRGTTEIRLLCNGPGRLTQALAITGEFNGTPLFSGTLLIRSSGSLPESGYSAEAEIVKTTRIGISKAKDQPYRFYLKGNPHISRR